MRKLILSYFLSQAFWRLILVSLFLTVSHNLFAQDQAAQIATQSDVANRQGPAAFPENAQLVISDPDLGDISLVNRAPRPKMFTFSTSQSFNYTTNAFLTETHSQDAFYYNGRIDAAFIPYATRDFTPQLLFEQDFFRYTRFSKLDFDSQTLQLSLKYDLFHKDTWFIDGSYGVSRLYAPHGSAGEFYKYGLADFNLDNYTSIGHWPVYLLSSLGAYSRAGDPSAFDRFGTYLSFAALYRPIDQIQISAFLRPEGQFYTNDPNTSSRNDFNLSLGSAAAWIANQYVSVGASLTFVGNYSSAHAQSYNVFSPAISVGAQISF